jgi:hypothetical protein
MGSGMPGSTHQYAAASDFRYWRIRCGLCTAERNGFFCPKWPIFLVERDNLGGSLFIKSRLSKRKKCRALTAPAHRDQCEHIERTWIVRIRAACERFLCSRGLKKKTARK